MVGILLVIAASVAAIIQLLSEHRARPKEKLSTRGRVLIGLAAGCMVFGVYKEISDTRQDKREKSRHETVDITRELAASAQRDSILASQGGVHDLLGSMQSLLEDMDANSSSSEAEEKLELIANILEADTSFVVMPEQRSEPNAAPSVISDNWSPVVTVCNNFDPLSGMTAFDPDGDPVRVHVTGLTALDQALERDQPGEFTLTYAATDFAGGFDIVHRTVTVIADCND